LKTTPDGDVCFPARFDQASVIGDWIGMKIGCSWAIRMILALAVATCYRFKMSMSVRLSDALVLDARLAGEVMERSISGQVEYWARLGRAIDPVLNGVQAMAVCRRGMAHSLSELLAEIESPTGRQRLADHINDLPFPHYQPHPDQPKLLIRIESNGTRTGGHFVQRVFTPVDDA
jgi:hypothetical protein